MNYMKEVAALLGVGLGEIFEVAFCAGENKLSGVFMLTEDGQCLRQAPEKGHSDWEDDPCALRWLLVGRCQVVKKPWKPKEGGCYYCVSAKGNVFEARYDSSSFAIMYIRLGNCYPTYEAAFADRDKWVKFYQCEDRIYWEGQGSDACAVSC